MPLTTQQGKRFLVTLRFLPIAALAQRFGIEARISEGAVAFHLAGGEEFVPRLFAELAQPIRSIRVARPTLDDVFMTYTGRTIRDAAGLARCEATADGRRGTGRR